MVGAAPVRATIFDDRASNSTFEEFTKLVSMHRLWWSRAVANDDALHRPSPVQLKGLPHEIHLSRINECETAKMIRFVDRFARL